MMIILQDNLLKEAEAKLSLQTLELLDLGKLLCRY